MLDYKTYRKIVHIACEPAATDDKEMEKVSILSDDILQFLMAYSGLRNQDILAALDLTTYEIARKIYYNAKAKQDLTPSP